MTQEEAIIIVEAAITSAELINTISEQSAKVEGMTSLKVKNLLNNIGANVYTYLEIGLYRGATFLSAIEGNTHLKAVGCDNWSQFKKPREEFKQNLKARLPGAETTIYDTDCFSPEFLKKLKKYPPFEVFFYDGNHSADDQEKAVKLYKQIMPDIGILIVDDWRKWGKKPTLSAVKKHNLNLLNLYELHDGWWEGIGILILQK
jgi:hypothetical protein